jgi:hypothetical protein
MEVSTQRERRSMSRLSESKNNPLLDKKFGSNYSVDSLTAHAEDKLSEIEVYAYLDSGTLRKNFMDDANNQLAKIVEKNSTTASKKFIRLLDVTDKYIDLLKNIHALNEQINNPKSYVNIPEQERQPFYENLLKAAEAARAVAVPILSRRDLLDPTNLKHLGYLNKTVLALTAHAKLPTAATTDGLIAASKNLDNLKVTRPVQILKGALKMVVANSLRVLQFIGLVALNLGSATSFGVKTAEKNDMRLVKTSQSGYNDLSNTGNRAAASAGASKLQDNLKLFGHGVNNKPSQQDLSNPNYTNKDRFRKR